MSEKLVTIATYTDTTEAELARQLLADFAIEAVVTDQNAANIFAGLPTIANVELQTLESNAKKAIQILRSDETQDLP